MSIWPTAVASDSDLHVVTNNAKTFLTDNPLTSGASTVNVTDTSLFPNNGTISIDNEIIHYTGKSSSSFTGCSRGFDGTIPSAHALGAEVDLNVIAFHHNALKNEIEAVESFLDAVLGHATGVTSAEFSYVHGVTSPIQTQLNSKMSNFLPQGKIWIGDIFDASQPQTLSGDLTVSVAGVVTLANTTVVANPYTWVNLTVDSKGRITAASSNAVPVTSLTGTTNQVNVSGSTGAVTLSTPQNIDSGASPTFLHLTLSQTTGTSPLTISSITEVTNLNSQLWHGQTYPLGSQGDLFYGGIAGVATALTVGTSTQVIHGGTIPTYAPVTEADFSFSNITTANATTARHGLLPQLSNNATQFLNGQGNFTTVTSGAAAGYISQSFSSVTSVHVIHNLNGYPNVSVVDNQATPNVLIPLSIVHNSLNDFTVNFSASSSGTVTANLGSPGIPQISTQVSNYSITANDNTILANGVITITLPTAVGIAGRSYNIKRINLSGNVSLATTSSQTIDAEASPLLLTSQYDSVTVISDGANWLII